MNDKKDNPVKDTQYEEPTPGPILNRLDEVALIEANTIEAMMWLIKDRATVCDAVRWMQRALDAKNEYRVRLMRAGIAIPTETETSG